MYRIWVSPCGNTIHRPNMDNNLSKNTVCVWWNTLTPLTHYVGIHCDPHLYGCAGLQGSWVKVGSLSRAEGLGKVYTHSIVTHTNNPQPNYREALNASAFRTTGRMLVYYIVGIIEVHPAKSAMMVVSTCWWIVKVHHIQSPNAFIATQVYI